MRGVSPSKSCNSESGEILPQSALDKKTLNPGP
jgi:hypothetical protein